MSRAAVAIPEEEYFDCPGVVEYLKSKGLKYVTQRSVLRATYEGRKLLQRTKIGARVYWHIDDVDVWLAILRNQEHLVAKAKATKVRNELTAINAKMAELA